jgi:integrase
MRIVCLVARHWVGVEPDHLSELWVWTKDVSTTRHGMVQKNKELLMQLRDPQVLARLLGLPAKIMREELAKPSLRRTDAVRAQIAFVIKLLLNAPARPENISTTHLDRHVRRIGKGADEKLVLEFSGAEVKNNRDLMYPLSESTKELFDLYLDRVRPKFLHSTDNRYLFPGEADGPKGSSLLSQQIGDLTKEVVGIRVTAHQFRCIVAFLHLRRSGNDLLTVKEALGHNSIGTTSQYYAWLQQEDALATWNETLKLTEEELAPLMDNPAPTPRRRRRRKS